MRKSVLLLLPLLFVICQCGSSSNDGNGGNGGFGNPPTKGGNPTGQVNIDGKWTGSGSITEGNNQPVQCVVNFEFKQSATQIEVVNGNYTCGQTYNYSWNALIVDVNGNKILFQTQEIGTINGSAITITEGTDTLTIEKVGTGLNISETKTENGTVYKIVSQLTKQ